MDLADFRVSYPELADADDPFVEAKLAEAATMVSSDVFASRYDLAHGLKTADLIQTSPGGQQSRMASKDGESTYGKKFDRLLQECTCMIRTFG